MTVALHILLHRFYITDNRGLHKSRFIKKKALSKICLRCDRHFEIRRYNGVTVVNNNGSKANYTCYLSRLVNNEVTIFRNTGERVNRLKFCII